MIHNNSKTQTIPNTLLRLLQKAVASLHLCTPKNPAVHGTVHFFDYSHSLSTVLLRRICRG